MYKHQVHYYETDKMGITHHSNYIRWMEEARIAWLDEMGWSFRRLEDSGIFSPVLSVDCRFRSPSTFPDEISIDVRLEKLTGAKLCIAYTMTGPEGKLVATGHSEHCFTDAQGNILRLKRNAPELWEALNSHLEEAPEAHG